MWNDLFCFVIVHPKQELIFVSVLFINAWLKFHCIIYDHTNKDTGLICSKLDLYNYHHEWGEAYIIPSENTSHT